jgi:photosystem II stability/assembly factor-like uncharacterized protein
MSSAPSSSASRSGTRSRIPLHSLFFLAMAAIVAAGASYVAMLQQSRPDPYRPADLMTERWRYPMQRNAFARNEAFEGNLNAVFVRPGGKRVWAVGDGALLLHSDDGGISWVQDTLDLSPDPDGDDQPAPAVVTRQDSTAPDTPDTTSADTLKKMSMLPVTAVMGLGRAVWNRVTQGQVPPPGQQQSRPSPAQQPTRPTAIDSVLERLNAAEGLMALGLTRIHAAQDSLAVRTAKLRDVQFIDDTLGYAVGDGGVVLRTRDGGAHWRWNGPRLPEARLLRVEFVSPDTGWTRSDSTLYRTTTAGRAWDALARVPDSLSMFEDPRLGIVVVSGFHGLQFSGHEARTLSEQDVAAAARLSGESAMATEYAATANVASPDLFGFAAGPKRRLGTGALLRGTALRPAAAFFFDSVRGWAVTGDGRLHGTINGGRRWQVESPGGPPLHDIHFADAKRGWAVGAEGTILSTSDGGDTWMVRAGRRDRIRDVDFIDRHNGWAVGSGGAILHSTNGGRSWKPQASPTDSTLHAVSFATPDSGMAVGAGGTVLRTVDGGRHWSALPVQNAPPRLTFHAVQMMRGGRGWIAGSRGYLFGTSDGGESWRFIRTSTGQDLHAVLFRNPSIGWVAGDAGRLLYTGDGGRTWSRRALQPVIAPIEALVFAPGSQTVWAAGARGVILSGHDSVFERHTTGTDAHLTDIRFTDARHGWATGWNGAMLATTDGGASWRRDSSGTRADLLALDVVDPQHLWAAGKGAVVLRIGQSGRWERTALPGPWIPAPWYGLSWAVVLGLVMLSVPPRRPPEERDPVEGILISDRPMQPGDPDPFQLNDVALGISRFLRNQRTVPPLTLAVTGPWGSGKSSLMNLIGADLRRWRFRTLSFNAWHHQTEDHLLAAFLENVKQQAVPPWWHPSGLRFRLSLLWIRTQRYRPLAILAALGAAVYMAWLLADPDRVGEVVAELGNLIPKTEALKGKGPFDTLKVVVGTLIPGPEQAPAVLGLLGTLGVVGTALRGAKAFGVKPASLMASVTKAMRIRDLEAQTSFRHRFAKEFDEVTRALSPRDMVIFVDDLDRCRSAHVLQILEAINFLVTSGRCVVIMGIDPERVIRSVGREFGKEGEDAPDPRAPEPWVLPAAASAALAPRAPAPQDAEEADRRRREAFARQYLEKLVNIEIPVPRGSDEQQGRLLEPAELEPEGTTVAERLTRLGRWVRPALPVGLTAAACLLILLFGRAAFRAPEAMSAAGTIDVAAALVDAPDAGRTAPAQPSPSVATPPPVDSVPAPEIARAGFRLPSPGGSPSRAALYLGVLLALGVGLVRLLNRPDRVVDDSDLFRKALRAWSPYIVAARRPTPRTAKKFLNRVRYYAMRQSANTPPHTLLGGLKTLPFRNRWLKPLLGKMGFAEPAPASRAGDVLPEELLVALAAVQECAPAALQDDGTYRRFGEFLGEVKKASPTAYERIRDLGYPATITPEQREHFARISAGIRVS